MQSRVAIFTTLGIALALTLLPMPHWAIWLRPAWILMVLIYWAIHLPNKVNIGTAWVVGLLIDFFGGILIGEHAFAYTIIIYFVNRMHIRLRMFPLLQQAMFVFVFIFIYQFIIYCIQGLIGELPNSYLYWSSSIISMLLWPWFFILMRDFNQRVRIA